MFFNHFVTFVQKIYKLLVKMPSATNFSEFKT